MKILMNVTLSLLLVCIISGCIEEKQEVYLNPDGSGRVIYEATTSIDFNLDFDKGVSLKEDKALKEANSFLTSSKGVDAWKDVSFRIRDDGRFFFKGTAYFKKLSKLQIHGRLKLQNMETIFKETGNGGMELVFTPVKEEKRPEKKKTAKKLSKKELGEKIKSEKSEFAKKKMMMAAMFSSLRIERLFHLPGVLDEFEVFKRDAGSNTVAILYKGEDILRAFDELMANDDWWKNQVLAGDGKVEGPSIEELNEKIFGQKTIARAVVKGRLAPLFDYTTEMEAAKKAYPEMCVKLGLKKPVINLPPAKGVGFKSLRVGGVRLIYESDDEANVKPFHKSRGYALSLIGKFPGAVLAVRGGKLKKAVTDTDEDLLPESEWWRSIDFPRLSNDGLTVVFEIKLNMPQKNMQCIKEISGELTYMVAKGTKKIDLGILDLKEGAKGKELGVKIISSGKSKDDPDKYELSLKLNAVRDEIIGISFVDVSGKEISGRRYSSMEMDRDLTLTYHFNKSLPDRARIVIEMHEDSQKYTIPFKLENISLLGKPVK